MNMFMSEYSIPLHTKRQPNMTMTKKRTANDAFGRMQHSSSTATNTSTNTSTNTNNKSGRGSEAGWTKCPLCPNDTNKVFAMGRGLAAHLNSVHTPWNPSARELKRRRKAKNSAAMRGVSRKKKRKLEASGQQMDNHNNTAKNTCMDTNPVTSSHADADEKTKWEPTQEEKDAWNAQVLEYVANAEPIVPHNNLNGNGNVNVLYASTDKNDHKYDRTGAQQTTYRASLPPFLQAAADGDLMLLQQIISSADTADGDDVSIRKVIDTVDRNGSIAEHWAAGGGHVPCLKYLMDLRTTTKNTCRDSTEEDQSQQMIENHGKKKKKVRRRDGKTTLHYAARYGRDECIELIAEKMSVLFDVDKPSGDGSTALHLACYGGYLETVKLLVEQYGADINRSNAWGCTAAHWACMSVASPPCTCNIDSCTTISSNHDDGCKQPMPKVLELLHYLKFTRKVPFHIAQSQGHTPLHKAALKRNDYVIKWLWENMTEGERSAITVDEGGHMPSDVYASVGGKQEFVKWMRDVCRW